MFTVAQIKQAHSKVQSGADFPKYIREIKALGVTAFESRVKDGHTAYFGNNDYSKTSTGMYADLVIADSCDTSKFMHYLRIHQQGETDFLQFCRDCAETGIEKWIVNLVLLTCTYYDKAGNTILVEKIPG